MAVEGILLLPLSHLLGSEEPQIDEDHGIAKFRQLPWPCEAVGHLMTKLM